MHNVLVILWGCWVVLGDLAISDKKDGNFQFVSKLPAMLENHGNFYHDPPLSSTAQPFSINGTLGTYVSSETWKTISDLVKCWKFPLCFNQGPCTNIFGFGQHHFLQYVSCSENI